MKTYLDIIEDTVEYYFTHNRGTDGTGCKYITTEGDMCAIGRYAKNPQELEDLGGDINQISSYFLNPNDDLDLEISNREYNELLKDELLKEDISHLNNYRFWNELQGFHDNAYNWVKNNKGGWSLTEHGQEKYIYLLETDWD